MSCYYSNGQYIREFKIPTEQGDVIRSARFSPCGLYLGVLCKGEPARIYSVDSSRILLKRQFLPIMHTSVAFDFGGSYCYSNYSSITTREVAIADDAGKVRRFKPDTGDELPGFRVAGANCLRYNESGNTLAVGTNSGRVVLFNLHHYGNPTPVIVTGFGSCVTALAFGAMDSKLFATTARGKCFAVELTPAPQVAPCCEELLDFYCLDAHNYGPTSYLALSGKGNAVHILHANGTYGTLHNTVLTGVGKCVTDVQLFPDRSYVSVIGAHGAELWDFQRGELVCSRMNQKASKVVTCKRPSYSDLMVAIE